MPGISVGTAGVLCDLWCLGAERDVVETGGVDRGSRDHAARCARILLLASRKTGESRDSIIANPIALLTGMNHSVTKLHTTSETFARSWVVTDG